MRARVRPSVSGVPHNGRRLLLLGIAAVMAVSAAYAVGAGSQSRAHTPIEPSTAFLPTGSAQALSSQADASPRAGPGYAAVLVRPGISVYAANPDGAETLVRTVSNSVLPRGHTLANDGAVSANGWLRLEDTGGKPGIKEVVAADLRHPDSEPWVVPGAFGCCPAGAWGPSGLLASESADAPRNVLIIADPVSRTTRLLSLNGDLAMPPGSEIPDIIWTQDGGILEGPAAGFRTQYLDGRPDSFGYPAIYEKTWIFGPRESTLTVCSVGANPCPINASAGGVRLLTADGVSENVYAPGAGEDRVLAAGFGRAPGHYWLVLDHDGGRQIRIVESTAVGLREVAIMTRESTWDSFFVYGSAPDESMLAILAGGQDGATVVLVPTGGGSASGHPGSIAGWMTTQSSTSAR